MKRFPELFINKVLWDTFVRFISDRSLRLQEKVGHFVNIYKLEIVNGEGRV